MRSLSYSQLLPYMHHIQNVVYILNLECVNFIPFIMQRSSGWEMCAVLAKVIRIVNMYSHLEDCVSMWNTCGDTHISLQLLTALLPLSVHPHITPLLTALLPLSTANNENGPRQAERHEGSHAQRLGQLANGRAGDSRRPVYKEAFQPMSSVRRKAVHSEEVNCQQQHSKKELLQGSRETAHNARLPGHAGSWTRPSRVTASSRWPATVPTTLPWASIRDQPRIRRTATSYSPPQCRRDIYRADQSFSNRQGSLTTHPVAGLRYSATIRPAPICTANYNS